MAKSFSLCKGCIAARPIANGLQLILAVMLIVLGLNIVLHSVKSYRKSEKNSEKAAA